MTGRKVRILFDIVFRLGLGGLFVYSAWGKIQDPALFADSVAGYQMLPSVVVSWVALVLPMVELLSGVLLVFTKWSREGALLIGIMLAVFLLGLTQALARGLDISCGCFGESETEGGTTLGGAVVRDLLLFIPTIWLMFRPNGWIWRGLGRGLTT